MAISFEGPSIASATMFLAETFRPPRDQAHSYPPASCHMGAVNNPSLSLSHYCLYYLVWCIHCLFPICRENLLNLPPPIFKFSLVPPMYQFASNGQRPFLRISLNIPKSVALVKVAGKGNPKKTRASDTRPCLAQIWPNSPTMATRIPTRPPAWLLAWRFVPLALSAPPSTWPPSTFTSAPPSFEFLLVLFCSWLLQ